MAAGARRKSAGGRLREIGEKFLKNMLTNMILCSIVYKSVVAVSIPPGQAAVAQSVERRIGSAEVTGPIPVSSFENP